MTIRPARSDDLSAILDIVNDAILHTTAWYDDRPRTLHDQQEWLANKHRGNWPVIVAEEDGEILGFATFDVFRARPSYRHTAEHSVYVRGKSRGHGTGRKLLEEIVEIARQRGLHVLIGGVDSENVGSLSFHRRLGFTEVGRLPQVGHKFGRWLTLVFMHRIIEDPISQDLNHTLVTESAK